MYAQPNRTSRRRRKKTQQKTVAAEPIMIAARRPGSPRLEKPTRRMKAASARPRSLSERPAVPVAAARVEETTQKKREARIIQRPKDTIDETEQNRRRLFSQYMASEGPSAITRTADNYFRAGFEIPREQEAHLKLLEHGDEKRAREAIAVLKELIQLDSPKQLPLLKQRLRRLEDHGEEAETRLAASELRRALAT